MKAFRVTYWYMGDEHIFPRLIEAFSAESAETIARRIVACPIVRVEEV